VGRHPVARPHGGCKDCVALSGAPMGHAARPDPCCRRGVGHGAVQPTPLPWPPLGPPRCRSIGLIRASFLIASLRMGCWAQQIKRQECDQVALANG
jgi:hypothetical protein